MAWQSHQNTQQHRTWSLTPRIDALTKTSLDDLLPSSAANVEENMAMAEMLRMQAHLLQLEIAAHHKSLWDARTPAVEFAIGDLVQWYNSARDGNYKTINKLAPRWSTPHIISGKSLNSYTLTHINGTLIPGNFASYRIRKYLPLRGSDFHAGLPATETKPLEHLNNRQDTEDRMGDAIFHPFVESEPL